MLMWSNRIAEYLDDNESEDRIFEFLKAQDEDELYIWYAESCTALGVRGFSPLQLARGVRELHVMRYTLNLQRACYLERRKELHEKGTFACGTLLAPCSKRTAFFGRLLPASDNECSIEHARSYATITHEVVVEGYHADVSYLCLFCRDPMFVHTCKSFFEDDGSSYAAQWPLEQKQTDGVENDVFTSGCLCVQEGISGNTPLVAVFGVNGDCKVYSQLASKLDLPGFPIYALQARDASSFSGLADGLAVETIKLCGVARYHLIGASFGGLLAHQIACTSKRLGGSVGRLILVDPLQPALVNQVSTAVPMATSYDALLRLLEMSNDPQASLITSGLEAATASNHAQVLASRLAFLGRRPYTAAAISRAVRELKVTQMHLNLLATHIMSMGSIDKHTGGILAVAATEGPEQTQSFLSRFRLAVLTPNGLSSYGHVLHYNVQQGQHIGVVERCLSGREPHLVALIKEVLQWHV